VCFLTITYTDLRNGHATEQFHSLGTFRVPALKQGIIPFSTICSKAVYIFSARPYSQCEFLIGSNITSMANVTKNIFSLPQ
jgi:hypothetical protein